MSKSLYLVVFTDEHNTDVVSEEYKEEALVVDEKVAFIYPKGDVVTTCAQVVDRLGIKVEGSSGLVVEMVRGKYNGVLRSDFVDWLTKVDNDDERK